MTGERKQSVGDPEKLRSPSVGKWLNVNGFLSEARLVEAVSNWHKASDSRGMSEAEREKNNLTMLDYLLEDWMRKWGTVEKNTEKHLQAANYDFLQQVTSLQRKL